MSAFDLVVIGAGPAGLAAATSAARLGLTVQVLDEQGAPGGQIHRNVEASRPHPGAPGEEDRVRGARLAAEFRESGASYSPGAQVWQIERDGTVCLTREARAERVHGRRVLIAAGAMERPMPIPGWTLPGVASVGAAQIMLKSIGAVPEDGTWIAGCGPLLLLYAAQAIEAGARIEGVLDLTPAGNFRRALRHGLGALRGMSYIERGLSLARRIRRAGVPLVAAVSEVEALGHDRLHTVRYRALGRWHERPARALLLHNGVVPNLNLALSAGCRHEWNAAQRCFVPVLDRFGNSSVANIAIAGDCGGIGGAIAAELRGRLAALDAAHALGLASAQRRDSEAAPIEAELSRHLAVRPFLEALYAPRHKLLAPASDVVICRCENITAGAVRETVRLGCRGPNQMKAFTRCGMGPCQGRLCGLTAAELIAEARGLSPGEIGYYRIRPPVKPLTLGELASLGQR